MADNDYRSYRSRDPVARDDGDQPFRDNASDPLAELARIIGQSDPYSDAHNRDRYGPADSGEDAAAPELDWAADDGYAEDEPHARAHERYVQPPPPPVDAPQSYAPPRSYESEPTDSRLSSGPASNFNGFRENDNEADYQAADDPGYRNEQYGDEEYRDEEYREEPPVRTSGRQQPAFTSTDADEPDDHYAAEPYEHEHDQDYGADDYYEEPPPRRRGGFVVVMAVLGLAVLGTAGAFGYRAMFGASVLPALPPIIKAGNGPNKIMPSYGDARPSGSSQTGTANAGPTEKLVSREEQPVDIQQPQPTAPRVISTIPIAPSANQGVPPGMTAPPPSVQVAPSAASPWPSSPAPLAPAPAAAEPPAMAAPVPPPAVPAPAPATVSAEPKKIHTLTIRTNPPASDGAAAPLQTAPTPRAATRTAAAAPKPSAQHAPAAPAPSGSQPLSLVPTAQDDGAPLPPPPLHARAPATRTAVASAAPAPTTAAATSSGGGYAVQVTSQRSEAEAQAAFRELRNKFPNQLGGKDAIVRRADLGAKGVYYRALVGPFASQEAAAGMCSSLKAAGGTCLVQKN